MYLYISNEFTIFVPSFVVVIHTNVRNHPCNRMFIRPRHSSHRSDAGTQLHKRNATSWIVMKMVKA